MKSVIACALLATVFLSACKSDYDRMIEEGLASGERHDSLFLGLRLDMSKKDFFTHCWELNSQHLIKQGSGNTSVQYDLEELKASAQMNFYPFFFEDKIHEMPVVFSYKAWAPWNREYWSDSLLVDVKNLMERWYGPGFVPIKLPKKGNCYVKVDGNRRIILWTEDEQFVKALYTDLIKEKELNAAQQPTPQE